MRSYSKCNINYFLKIFVLCIVFIYNINLYIVFKILIIMDINVLLINYIIYKCYIWCKIDINSLIDFKKYIIKLL